MNVADTIAQWGDEERAEAIRELIGGMLGPKSLDAQTGILPSCAREFVILKRPFLGTTQTLLFQRPQGVRYGGTWHFSGTTVQKKRVGKEPWDFVREKYQLTRARLSRPEEIDFVIIPEGNGARECEFGEVWTQINIVHWKDGETPANSRWFPLTDLPDDCVPYHKHVLADHVESYICG